MAEGVARAEYVFQHGFLGICLYSPERRGATDDGCFGVEDRGEPCDGCAWPLSPAKSCPGLLAVWLAGRLFQFLAADDEEWFEEACSYA